MEGTPSRCTRCTGSANKEAVSEGLQQDALPGEGQLGAKWGTGLDSTCQGQCRRGEGGCGALRCLPARISFRTWGSSGFQRMAIGHHSCPWGQAIPGQNDRSE